MKRIYVFLLCVLLAALTGCSPKQNTGKALFDLDKAALVVFHGGDANPGLEFEIEDAEMVGKLRDMFYAPAYEKDKSSKDYVGCGDELWWYDDEGELLAVIDVRSEDYIEYDDYFYSLSGGMIDMSSVEKQLEEAYPFYRALDNAAWLTIFDGHTGEQVEIHDPETVEMLRDMLRRKRLKKGESSADRDGFSYNFTWYGENDEVVCSIASVTDRVIDYKGWFYKALNNPEVTMEETIEKVFDEQLGEYVFPWESYRTFVEDNGIDCVWISTPEKEVASQDGDHVYNSIRAFGGVRVREVGPASEEDYKNYTYKVAWGKKGWDYEGIGMEIVIREDGALIYDYTVHEVMSEYNGKYVVTQYLDEALEDPAPRIKYWE